MEKKLTLRILGQPDPSSPSDIHLVGRYALGVTWADNHGSIYPFESLRRSCADCEQLASVSPEMSWPRSIRKAGDVLEITWSDGHESRYGYGALRAACRCAACTGGH